MRRSWSFLVLFLLVIAVPPAFGAGLTEVTSSADSGPSALDRFDLNLGLRWDWMTRKSLVSREIPCTASTPGCAGTGTSLRPILDTTRTAHQLDVDLRLGLYHGLELFAVLPVVLKDTTSVGLASGVTAQSSTLYPPSLGTPLFGVPNDSPKRSGFGDMSIGLRYAPMEQWRNSYYPTLLLGLTYTAPTGNLRQGGNTGVGEGVHTVRLELDASRRFDFVEPYFGFFGDLRVPAKDTLFRTYDADTQRNTGPGHDLGITVGAEWYPWQKPQPNGKPGAYAAIDVGFLAKYTFQGREYTDLFDAFANSNCKTELSCQSPVTAGKNRLQYDRTRDNDPTPGITYMDGITDVSPYGTFQVWTGLRVAPVQWIELAFRFTYSRETSHFLTYADTGTNLDTANGLIETRNADGRNEFNPVYNSDVDQPGYRFKSEGTNVYGVMLQLTGKL